MCLYAVGPFIATRCHSLSVVITMLALSALGSLLLLTPGVAAWKPTSYSYINYTTVTGFFMQDDPATVDSTFDYVSRAPVLSYKTAIVADYELCVGCEQLWADQ